MNALPQDDDANSHTEPQQETRAERKERASIEGKAALAYYVAIAAAVDKKTVRLRALRLAKEVEDRAAPAADPSLEKKKKAKRSPANLTKR